MDRIDLGLRIGRSEGHGFPVIEHCDLGERAVIEVSARLGEDGQIAQLEAQDPVLPEVARSILRYSATAERGDRGVSADRDRCARMLYVACAGRSLRISATAEQDEDALRNAVGHFIALGAGPASAEAAGTFAAETAA